MIVVGRKGGLGNQMFQYALYLSLVRKHDGDIPVKMYSMLDKSQASFLPLEYFFDVSPDEMSSDEILHYLDCSRSLWARIRRRILRINRSRMYIDKECFFQPDIFDMDECLLDGYWQSEKYFKDIEQEVHNLYVMKDYMTEYQRGICEQIRACESVSVHIRRGDYLKFSDIYGGICTETYYKNAMDIFEGKNVIFYIFSNDYEYVKENYNFNNTVIVRAEQDPLACNMDMHLMSQCKHNIIANSSFSWWGAWLNENPNKIVVAPQKWINTKELEDICPQEWVRV